MSFIVPQSNSNIGKLLVSISSISESYVYNKVRTRHIKETLDWFFNEDVFTPTQILRGLEKELYVLENDIALRCSTKYKKYCDTIRLTEDEMIDRFPVWDYPQFYV